MIGFSRSHLVNALHGRDGLDGDYAAGFLDLMARLPPALQADFFQQEFSA